MFRIDTSRAAASLPVPAAVGTQGYFQETSPLGATQFSADWCNWLQEEPLYCLLKRGGTPDKADYHQFWDEVLLAEQAVKSHATDTTAVTTDVTCAVMAVTSAQASGANSACVGSSYSVASANPSACVGSYGSAATGGSSGVIGSYGSVDTPTASGVGSVVVGCRENVEAGGNASVALACDGVDGKCEASVARSAVIACEDGCDAGGVDSIVAASDGNDGACTTSGAQSAIIASASATGLNTLVSGAQCAIIASASVTSASTCAGSASAIIASIDTATDGAHGYQAALGCAIADIDGDNAVAIGGNDVAVSGQRSTAIGSKGYELHDSDTIGGGYNAGALTPSGANQNLTWKIDASDGCAFLAGDLEVGGNVNTEASATITLTGSTGAIIGALLFITGIKSGATQGGAGAAAGEVWKTASHATLPDNVLMIGV